MTTQAQILKHYFRLLFTAADLRWDADNEAEVDEAFPAPAQPPQIVLGQEGKIPFVLTEADVRLMIRALVALEAEEEYVGLAQNMLNLIDTLRAVLNEAPLGPKEA